MNLFRRVISSFLIFILLFFQGLIYPIIPFVTTVYAVEPGDPPVVNSINRVTSSTTNATSVDFTVTFSETVTGVDANDFALTTTGVAGASITGVTGSGSVYTVSVDTGTGDGTIRLDVNDDDTIADTDDTLALGGVGAGNGNFTTGQVYTIDKTSPTVTDAKISISGASGTGGAYKTGDTVTATWDNTGTGDNNSDIASVTVNFSQFGGGAIVGFFAHIFGK